MLAVLFFTKLSAVLTVLYAGLNLYQLTTSHSEISEKIDLFRAQLAGTESPSVLVRLNLVFYLVLPVAYLVLLRVSAVGSRMLALLALKFAFTAFLDINSERRILAGGDYTVSRHAFSRADNLANIAAAAGIIYLLLRPAGLIP
jgi:hypothetical protein